MSEPAYQFERKLADRLQRIFGWPVKYGQPSESQEQETLFVDIEINRGRVKDKKATARVTGTAYVYANYERVPFGYMAQRIDAAEPEDTKDLFFFDVDANTKTLVNLVQRSVSFVFLFSGQYDPDDGTITSIELEEGTPP